MPHRPTRSRRARLLQLFSVALFVSVGVDGAVVQLSSSRTTSVQTRFGAVPAECVLEVPSGSLVVHRDALSPLSVHLPSGDFGVAPPCSKRWMSREGDANRSAEEALPPSWEGWAQHMWNGNDFAYFDKPALDSDIVRFNASAIVPASPLNPGINPASPWPYDSTQSFWIGIQAQKSFTVLQPVLEWNGLIRGAYDLSSWNCCPSGYLVHSTPVTDGVTPGTSFFGSVEQNDTSSQKNIFTVSSVSSTGKSTVLHADLSAVEGWSPRWAEVVWETYFITECSQLSTTPAAFWDINLVTRSSYPNPIPNVPWKPTFVTNDQSIRKPPCGSTVIASDEGHDVALGYDTGAKCSMSTVSSATFIPNGYDVFYLPAGSSVDEALNRCLQSAVCDAVTVSPTGEIWGKTVSITSNGAGWRSFTKQCQVI